MTMWKETYRLGVEKIDEQHKTLFEIAGKLVQEIEGEQNPEIYRQTIAFLKYYVATHFRDEEQYVASIGYAEEAEHKRQHRELTRQVEKYDAQLKESNYDLHTAKKLAGMLSAWLIYHVVNEDMKYIGKCPAPAKQEDSILEYFADSTIQVLESMAGMNPDEVKKQNLREDTAQEAVYIEIGLVGSLKGSLVFGFSKQFADGLMETMMAFSPEEIDELVCSALAEVSNISAGNGTIAIAQSGTACDICPPKILGPQLENAHAYEKVRLNTGIGAMTVCIHVD